MQEDISTLQGWPVVMLQAMRAETDPLADQVIKTIMESGQLGQVNEIFKMLVSNDELPQGHIPQVLKDYLTETALLPKWADPQKIKRAQAFFALHGPQVLMLLQSKSLPTSYSCWRGAEVLHRTGRLLMPRNNKKEINRYAHRLMETTQMVVDVLSPDGLAPDGRGIRSIQKVRLIHAAIRYYLLQEGDWDFDEYDHPINQEDMAGTVCSFGSLVLEGMEQLGDEVTQQEANDFVHIWNVIGHMLGLKRELMPSNWDSAKALTRAIIDHQKGYSQAGVELTEAIIEYSHYLVPGNMFDSFGNILTRYLIGEELSDMLKIEKSGALAPGRLLMVLCRAMFEVQDWIDDENDSRLIQMISRRFNRQLMQGIINHFNQHKQISFYIPPSLRKDWGL